VLPFVGEVFVGGVAGEPSVGAAGIAGELDGAGMVWGVDCCAELLVVGSAADGELVTVAGEFVEEFVVLGVVFLVNAACGCSVCCPSPSLVLLS